MSIHPVIPKCTCPPCDCYDVYSASDLMLMEMCMFHGSYGNDWTCEIHGRNGLQTEVTCLVKTPVKSIS